MSCACRVERESASSVAHPYVVTVDAGLSPLSARVSAASGEIPPDRPSPRPSPWKGEGVFRRNLVLSRSEEQLLAVAAGEEAVHAAEDVDRHEDKSDHQAPGPESDGHA